MTTFEDAKRCPKCDRPGKDLGGKPAKRPGVKVHTIMCETELCKWYQTTWLVQVNEDGTIPEAYSQVGKKQFPKVSPEMESRINDSLKAQLEVEKSGQGEVQNPYSR